MATETLYATSHLSGTAATPANAVGAPDGTYTTNSGNTSWTSRWALGDPSGSLTGTQSITVRMRRSGSGNGAPTVTVTLYENGASVSVLATAVAIGDGTDLGPYTFDASAITNPANVEVELAVTGNGGGPNARTGQVDSITFTAEVAVAGPVEGTIVSTLPALTASAAGEVVAPAFSGTTASALPALTSSAAGTFEGAAGPVQVATWDGTSLAPASTDPGWNVGNLTNDGSLFGPILANDNPTPNYATQPVYRWISNNVDETDAVANNQFWSVTISRVGGGAFTPGVMSFNIAKGGSFGSRGISIRTDEDAYATSYLSVDVPTVRATFTHYDVDLSGVGEVTSLTIRVYTWTPSTASTLEMDDLSLTATVSAGTGVSGTIASTLPALTQAASGDVTVPAFTGTAASSMPALTQAATGESAPPAFSGTVAATMPALAQSASGDTAVPTFTGAVTSTLPSLTQSGAGEVTSAGTAGSVASTLPGLTSAATGETTPPAFTGTIGSTMPSLSATASGTVETPAYSGAITGTLPALASSSSGTVTSAGIAGQVASTLPTMESTATGTTTVPAFTGTAAGTMPALGTSVTGTSAPPAFTATVTSTMPTLTQAATGTVPPPNLTGVMASTLPALTSSVTGTFSALYTDITFTVGTPTTHPLTVATPTGHALTPGSPTGHPLTIAAPWKDPT